MDIADSVYVTIQRLSPSKYFYTEIFSNEKI